MKKPFVDRAPFFSGLILGVVIAFLIALKIGYPIASEAKAWAFFAAAQTANLAVKDGNLRHYVLIKRDISGFNTQGAPIDLGSTTPMYYDDETQKVYAAYFVQEYNRIIDENLKRRLP